MIKTMDSMEKENQNYSTIKFNTEIIKYFLTDCFDAYILVTGDITVENGDNNTEVAFKTVVSLLDQSFI